MAKFSERYGYTAPSSVLIRESMPIEVQNAICTRYEMLMRNMESECYYDMEKHLWCRFLNKRLNDFNNHLVVTPYIESDEHHWFKKLDLIEETISYWSNRYQTYECYSREYLYYRECCQFLVKGLNSEFKRLNFAYRIIENKIVEITSKEEIVAIETALQNTSNGVKEHIHTALQLLAIRPEGDYRNSIKESISAVEAVVREITGAKTLNFTELERAGIVLPSVLKQSFEKLYGYTNDATTGIRHALMEDANAPGADEAIFMLVSCSAFINYLTKKKS